MSKIDIALQDMKDVKPKADELVKGQSYPFLATVRHSYKRGIVLGRANYCDIIPKDTDVVLPVQSYEMAWNIVADMAYLANFHGIEKFGSITFAAPAKAALKAAAAEVQA